MIISAYLHQTPPAPVPALAQRLDDIVADPANHDIDFGILITDTSGKVIYQHGQGERLMPASNMKVLTHVFAYTMLGADFKPVTRFWKQDQDVVVDAPGDPDITCEQISDVKTKLGVGSGFAVKVHGAFHGGYPDGWSNDDYQYKYGASIYPFTVADATVSLYSNGKDLESLPPYAGIEVKRDSETGPVNADYNFWARIVHVDGAFEAKRTLVADLPVADPQNYACGLLGGSLALSDTVPTRQPDAVIEGKSLDVMAGECLKPSDNRMAEHILQLATQAEICGCKDVTPDSYASDPFNVASVRMDRFFANKVGVDATDLMTFDGSGLSRKDRVTARALVKALQFASAQPWMSSFVKALPHSGEGTLRSRLKELNVSAKTGSLHDVAALSGYLNWGSAHPVIFSIIGNTHGRTASAVRAVADKIVREVADAETHHDPSSPTVPPPGLPNTGDGGIAPNRAS